MSLTLVLLLVGQVEQTPQPSPEAVPLASYSIHRPLREELLQTRHLRTESDPKLPPVPATETAPPPHPVVAAPLPLTDETSGYEDPFAASVGGTCSADSPAACSIMAGGATPGCPACPGLDGKNQKVCLLRSTCDMYPHYAYFPRYHGYYYFRPYNYTTIAEHQQFAACIGLDPRMPYSLKNFDAVYSSLPIQFSPSRAPIGTALPQGNGLPQLEDVLAPTADD